MTAFTIELELEDAVRDAVRDVFSDEYVASDFDERAANVFRDLAHDEGDAFVQNVIDNGGYLTESDLNGYVQEDALLDFVREDDLDERIDARLDTGPIDDLERRFDVYAQRVDDLRDAADRGAARHEEYNSELADLSLLAKRVEALEAQLGAANVGQALTFFALLRNAFNALRI